MFTTSITQKLIYETFLKRQIIQPTQKIYLEIDSIRAIIYVQSFGKEVQVLDEFWIYLDLNLTFGMRKKNITELYTNSRSNSRMIIYFLISFTNIKQLFIYRCFLCMCNRCFCSHISIYFLCLRKSQLPFYLTLKPVLASKFVSGCWWSYRKSYFSRHKWFALYFLIKYLLTKKSFEFNL